MLLGELLVAQGLVSVSDVDRALAHQKEHGGRLGECLVALDLVNPDALGDTLRRTPKVPMTAADIGLDRDLMRDLLLKAMRRVAVAGTGELADRLALSPGVVAELVDDARHCGLLEDCHAGNGSEMAFFRLTAKGADWAAAAMARSPYVGPAPVPLERFVQQVREQSIVNERLDPARIKAGFAGFVADPETWRMLGPAVNSDRAVLFYGPPGNGKTAIAQQVMELFSDVVHVPLCVEAGGEIIRVFDPVRHRVIQVSVTDDDTDAPPISAADPRWVTCARPAIGVGAELTAAALELTYDDVAGVHEAPLQMKALNGVLFIDDLGRQREDAGMLLNRWLAPMEAERDELRLHNGTTIDVPVDGLLLVAASKAPDDVIDADLMRRIPYKVELKGPSRASFAELLRAEFSAHLIELSEADAGYIMDMIEDRYGQPLAYYQPAFLVGRLVAACDYHGIAPAFSRPLAEDAISHLFVAAS